ncbi:hypothetical protein [Pontibacter roseus]|uniref:hypothetical protein n=1 Tax=Pontibacter roseus TaxID=336989 RepID=UPI000376690E|nr:hypothetical protein [Pontibacter roseus]
MNIYGNPAAKTNFESGSCPLVTTYSASSWQSYVEEEAVEYSTIDGEVITSMAGTSALQKGAGILIGDYFVGISESLQGFTNRPFLRY